MPTFHSTETTVRLSITEPVQSSSRQTVPVPSATNQIASAPVTHALLDEGPLKEEGDEYSTRFLGVHRDVPFFLVRAGRDIYRHDTTKAKKPPRLSSQDSGTLFITSAETTPASTPADVATQGAPIVSELGQLVQAGERKGGELSKSGRPLKRPMSPTAFSTLSRLSSAGSVTTPANHVPALPSPTLLQVPPASLPPPARMMVSEPPPAPRAMTLTVGFSKASFVPRFCETSAAQDLQITVFFNGEFSASRLVPMRAVKGVLKVEELTHIFTGRRVDRTVERRWILVPPGQNADGSLRGQKRNKAAYVTAEERWTQLSTALGDEAEKWGVNHGGDRSAMGSYLQSIAGLSLPAEVKGMQKSGGQKFGVMDVVICRGKGLKGHSSAPYLREPQRFLDPRFCKDVKIPVSSVGRENQRLSEKGKAPSTPSAVLLPCQQLQVPPTSPSTRSNTTISTPAIVLTPTSAQVKTPTTKVHPVKTKTKIDPKRLAPPKRCRAVRRRTSKNNEDNFPATLDESTSSISLAPAGRKGTAATLSFHAAGEAFSPKPLRGGEYGNPASPCPHPNPTANSPTGNAGAAVPAKRGISEVDAETDASIEQPVPKKPKMSAKSDGPIRLILRPPNPQGASRPASTPKSAIQGKPSAPAKLETRRLWTPSALNEDCHLTYGTAEGNLIVTRGGYLAASPAVGEDAPMRAAGSGKGSVVEGEEVEAYGSCKNERGGVFYEKEVLMGVRFIVG